MILIGILYIAYAAGLLGLCYHFWQAIRMVKTQGVAMPAEGVLDPFPTLDIVVPVKDEAAHIGHCLESILAQDYPAARIIVVNDRSTDETAQVIQSYQDRHPQIRRVDISELPAGLYGKPHALNCAADELHGDMVAFVDSDLSLNKNCLRTLVQHMVDGQHDWVAVMAAPEITQFWERLVVPLFGAIAFAWYDPRRISDPQWDDAIGSALMVCRRTAYQAIGGHGAVIDVYDEDSELIRIAKRSQQDVSFVLTPELVTQRHYGDLAGTIRGYTRTAVGGIKTIPRLLMTIQALNFVSLLPVGLLVLFGVLAWMDVPLMWGPLWWSSACFHLLVSTALMGMIYHTAKVDRRYALLHPLGSTIVLLVCMRAMVHLLRGEAIVWRGTEYPERDHQTHTSAGGQGRT